MHKACPSPCESGSPRADPSAAPLRDVALDAAHVGEPRQPEADRAAPRPVCLPARIPCSVDRSIESQPNQLMRIDGLIRRLQRSC